MLKLNFKNWKNKINQAKKEYEKLNLELEEKYNRLRKEKESFYEIWSNEVMHKYELLIDKLEADYKNKISTIDNDIAIKIEKCDSDVAIKKSAAKIEIENSRQVWEMEKNDILRDINKMEADLKVFEKEKELVEADIAHLSNTIEIKDSIIVGLNNEITNLHKLVDSAIKANTAPDVKLLAPAA